MKNILKLLKNNDYMNKIINSISNEQRVFINNTNEENALLTMMQYFYTSNETVFIITPNIYKAQLMYDKLCQVASTEDVCFFPQDEFITNEMLVSSMEFRVERINTIKKLIKNPKRMVVVNLFGILKPELPLKKWVDSVLLLNKNQDYSLDEITEVA